MVASASTRMRYFDTGTVRYSRRLVGQLSLYRDNSMLLELSTTCALSEAFQIAARWGLSLHVGHLPPDGRPAKRVEFTRK